MDSLQGLLFGVVLCREEDMEFYCGIYYTWHSTKFYSKYILPVEKDASTR